MSSISELQFAYFHFIASVKKHVTSSEHTFCWAESWTFAIGQASNDMPTISCWRCSFVMWTFDPTLVQSIRSRSSARGKSKSPHLEVPRCAKLKIGKTYVNRSDRLSCSLECTTLQTDLSHHNRFLRLSLVSKCVQAFLRKFEPCQLAGEWARTSLVAPQLQRMERLKSGRQERSMHFSKSKP